MLVGTLIDDDATDQTESVFSDISESIKVGPSGLPANVYEHEAKETAAGQLREARRRKHEDAVDAKAKLHRHRNLAGARS